MNVALPYDNGCYYCRKHEIWGEIDALASSIWFVTLFKYNCAVIASFPGAVVAINAPFTFEVVTYCATEFSVTVGSTVKLIVMDPVDLTSKYLSSSLNIPGNTCLN